MVSFLYLWASRSLQLIIAFYGTKENQCGLSNASAPLFWAHNYATICQSSHLPHQSKRYIGQV